LLPLPAMINFNILDLLLKGTSVLHRHYSLIVPC
jgi:hypothetical protein